MPRKKRYRIRNWSDYNKALVKRGSLTIWFDKNSIDSWYNQVRTGKKGRPVEYSDLSIQCCLTLKMIYRLPLRATQGFVGSLLELLKLPLAVPDYSLLCKRQKTLSLKLPNRKTKSSGMHLVVDATGLKLYGEGEWKVRKHGKDKRRTWLKLHLVIDEATHDIEACMLTGDDVHDSEPLPAMLNQVEGEIDQVTGDGAYDTHECYQCTIHTGADPCFPPRKNAVRHKPSDRAWILRNQAVSQVIYHDLKYWKKKHNYHRRSLAETAMFRFKQLLGDKVIARTPQRQAKEIGIKCIAINIMNQLGMPAY